MLTITGPAAVAIRELLAEQNVADGGLRFASVEEKGETGLELSAQAGPADGDATVEERGVRVYLDADAADALADQVLDVEAHGDHVHFTFLPQP